MNTVNDPLDMVNVLDQLLAELDFVIEALEGEITSSALQGATFILSSIHDRITKVEKKLKEIHGIK